MLKLKITITRDPRNKRKSWSVRWFTGEYDFDTGKQKRSQKSFQYKDEAESFKVDMKKAFKNGELLDDSKKGGTLSGLCKEWLQTRGKNLKIGTVELYQGTFFRLKDYFGANRPLNEITTQRAERFIVEQMNRTKYQHGQPLSVSSRNQIVRSSRALFAAGKKWGYIRTNPFEDIKTPEPESKRFHRFEPEQIQALMRAAPTLRVKTLYAVLLATGARSGAVLSRTWADIDFEHGEMIICNRKGSNALPPFTIKTKRQRKVPLPKTVLELLAELQSEAAEGNPYVFLTMDRFKRIQKKWRQCRKDGTPWKNRWLGNNVRRDFKAHCTRAGIKSVGQLTVHTLRKNTGQILADAGNPVKVVQTILGHSKVETTLKYYNQVEPHHRQQVVEVMDRLLNEKTADESKTEEVRISSTYEPVSDESKV